MQLKNYKHSKIYWVILLIFLSFRLNAQSNNITVKDTLYYLVDTAKIPKLDRMFYIENAKIPLVDVYHLHVPCFWENNEPTFIYALRKEPVGNILIKPTYISKSAVKKLNLISLWKLTQIVCTEKAGFTNKYVIFFIEHLPSGKYRIRKVKFEYPAKDD